MRKFWTVIGLFASATPVGIMLGVLLSTVANSDGAASVSALASGPLVPTPAHIAWQGLACVRSCSATSLGTCALARLHAASLPGGRSWHCGQDPQHGRERLV